MGWRKSPYVFFNKIKDTVFILTNNFIDLNILSMLAISCMVSQLMCQFDCYQLPLVYPTVEHHPVRNLQHETSQTTSDIFNQSQHLLHTLHNSFFAFQLHFTFLEIIKHNMPKMLLFSSIFNIKMATQKFTNFGKFLKKCILMQ